MLRTTKSLALALMVMLSVIALTGRDAHAFITSKKQQVNPVPVRKMPPVPAKAANLYVQKVNAFLKDPRWQPGTTYNASQKPKLSKYSCVGCCAYAADFVQYVFGKDSPRSGTLFTSINQIKAGDIIVVSNSPHWIVVLARSGNSLETLEGNWMGKAVRAKGAYTLNGNTLMRNGKKFRVFSLGYHFLQ